MNSLIQSRSIAEPFSVFVTTFAALGSTTALAGSLGRIAPTLLVAPDGDCWERAAAPEPSASPMSNASADAPRPPEPDALSA